MKEFVKLNGTRENGEARLKPMAIVQASLERDESVIRQVLGEVTVLETWIIRRVRAMPIVQT